LRIAGVTTVERAYELARSGQYRTVSEIKRRLSHEGFADATGQLTSRTLVNNLRGVLKAVQQDA
jgi:hypothetical protein